MEFSQSFSCIDTHTAGEPLRIVTSGIPFIPGETILAKQQWVKTHLDEVRQCLMYEPRGHRDMYGCYLTPAVTEDADVGVIFMHNEGYSSMCGHGIIVLAKVLVEQGMVARSIPETRVGIDTPAGFVEAYVQWDGHKAGQTRFLNVASFLFTEQLRIHTPSFAELVVDIAFGGAFYAYLDGAQANLTVKPENVEQLILLGDEVKHAVEARLEVVHPLEPRLRGIYGTIISGPPKHPEADQVNVCIFADRQVDRSPTGTGTAGRVAQLFAKGNLSKDRVLINESIIGTLFSGRVVKETRLGDYEAVIPEVCGEGFITGFCQWMVDPRDPVGQGFLIR